MLSLEISLKVWVIRPFLSGRALKKYNSSEARTRRRGSMTILYGCTVGLTGGLSSGKSTASDSFRARGITVVDADVFARAALNKGTSSYKQIVAAFGRGILRNDREIHRRRLGQIVFHVPGARSILHRLLGPYIIRRVYWEIVKLRMMGRWLIVVEAPLLFETEMEKITDQNVVIWVDQNTQIGRVMARDGVSEAVATNKIDAEMPLAAKCSRADWVIHNTGSPEDLDAWCHFVIYELSNPTTWAQFLCSWVATLMWIASGILKVPWNAMKYLKKKCT